MQLPDAYREEAFFFAGPCAMCFVALIGLSRTPPQCGGIRLAAPVDGFAPRNVNYLAVVVKVSGQGVVVGTTP
jgi:hypothetical protein